MFKLILLGLCLSVTFKSSYEYEEEFHVPSVRRTASIGDLYDLRRESIVRLTGFSSPDFLDAIEKSDEKSFYCQTFKSFEYKDDDVTFNDKFFTFNILPVTKLSYYAGLLYSNTLEYFLDDIKNNVHLSNGEKVGLVKSSIFCSLVDTVQKLSFSKLNKEIFYKSSIDQSDATHMIVGAKYGFTFLLTLSSEFPLGNLKERDAKAAEMNKFIDAVKTAIINGDESKIGQVMGKNFDMKKFFSKYSSQINAEGLFIEDFDDVTGGYIRNIIKILTTKNEAVRDGYAKKFVPLIYILIPLHRINSVFDLELKNVPEFRLEGEKISRKLSIVGREFTQYKNLVNKFGSSLQDAKSKLSKAEYETLSEKYEYAKDTIDSFEKYFARKLVEYRSLKSDDLETVAQYFYSNSYLNGSDKITEDMILALAKSSNFITDFFKKIFG